MTTIIEDYKKSVCCHYGKINISELHCSHMKRKLINLARSTHVITLPNAWIEHHNLQKGDELEVDEYEGSLIVEPLSSEKKLVTNVSGLGKQTKRFLNCCYKAGYDTIKVLYETDEELQCIEEDVHDYLVGLEITEINTESKTVLIKSIGTINGSEFNTILKRIFFILKQSFEELSIEKNDKEKIVARDIDVNKYSDYCRRILNMNALHVIDTQYKRNIPLYSVVEQLEKIGDDIRDLAKLNSELITPTITKIQIYFALLYDLFYKFSTERFKLFVTQRAKLREFIERCMEMDQTNNREYMYCLSLVEKIYDLNGPITVLHV